MRESLPGGLRERDPAAYADLERDAQAKANEIERLFPDQAGEIAERYQRERPMREAGVNPADLRDD